MNTNDELRAMLDERDVNWDYGITGAATTKFRANGVDLTFMPMRDGLVCTTILTPAQAVAATLGADDTYTREDVEGAFVSGYSLGLDMFDSSKPDNEKGWNQNERNLDEEMEDLGWVRKDAATFGAGTCHNVVLAEMEEKISKNYSMAMSALRFGGFMPEDEPAEFECFACGETAKVDWETLYQMKHCPFCGARIVEVES